MNLIIFSYGHLTLSSTKYVLNGGLSNVTVVFDKVDVGEGGGIRLFAVQVKASIVFLSCAITFLRN